MIDVRTWICTNVVVNTSRKNGLLVVKNVLKCGCVCVKRVLHQHYIYITMQGSWDEALKAIHMLLYVTHQSKMVNSPSSHSSL